MRGALFRNLALYSRNLHLSHNLKPRSIISHNYYSTNNYYSTTKYITPNAPLFSRIRFFSSENGTPDPDQKPESETASAVVAASDNVEASDIVEDVSNKEFKEQIGDYLHKFNEDALPTIFESLLKRLLSGKHEDTDDELIEEFRMKPLDDVKDTEFESDFEEGHETDTEIENLYSTREIAIKKMAPDDDPYFNMDDEKWDDMVKEAIKHGHLTDTKECEEILEDMLNWDKLLPDEIKKKVEDKFNEIGDRVEKGELEVEEGYALFKEFEDQMVLECTKLMEANAPSQFDDAMPDDRKELDDPPGEGPILRWQTRVVFSPGGDAWHPKNRKVKLAVTVKELGLSKHQFVRLRELAGKRYNPGKDELTITSERFEHREENRKDCLRTLFSLIEEAGKAKKLVEEARTAHVKERLKANPMFMQRLQAKTKTLTA